MSVLGFEGWDGWCLAYGVRRTNDTTVYWGGWKIMANVLLGIFGVSGSFTRHDCFPHMISRWRYYSIPVGYLAPVLALGFAADAIYI